MASFSEAAVRQLQASVGGPVALPGTADYEEAIYIWNAVITRRPAIVIRCKGTSDVVASLAFAREHGLEVSVRGGGHNFGGLALCEGGLMIDLTPMKEVSVDPVARRASCGGGTTWAEVDAATQAHGLAVPGGLISHTGVGGLTLGGGFGWLSRLAGLTCDNLVAAELVTADGRVLRASESEYSDLFWALRGGGGNFGVVTEFEFSLIPVGPLVQLGLFFFFPDQAVELLRFLRDYSRDLPDESITFLATLTIQPDSGMPVELHHKKAYSLFIVGFGDEEQHAELVAPMREVLTPFFEMLMPIPYVSLQSMNDVAAPFGMFSYEKGLYLSELGDEAIKVIIQHEEKRVSPQSTIVVYSLGGAYQRADENSTAFGGSHDVRYVVNAEGVSLSRDGYETERSWVREFWSDLVPYAHGTGSYVNFLIEGEQDRVSSTYGPKYERLQQIKAVYDPDNIFHINANIIPAQ